MSSLPRASIVLTSSDNWTILKLAESLLCQSIDVSRHELIVVDCVGKQLILDELEQVASIVKGAIPVRAVSLGHVPRAKARNAAISLASHDLLLFLGADILPEPTTVEQHLQFHQRYPEENKVAFGPTVFPERLREEPFRRWLDESGVQFGAPFTKGPRAVPKNFFYVTNTSIKKFFQERAGQYDERFPYHMTDDYEMGIRMRQIGIDMHYLPDAVCLHEHAVTLEERTQVMKQAAHSARIYESLFPEHGTLYKQYTSRRWHVGRAFLGRVMHSLLGSERGRSMYYGSTLATAFANEYDRIGPVNIAS